MILAKGRNALEVSVPFCCCFAVENPATTAYHEVMPSTAGNRQLLRFLFAVGLLLTPACGEQEAGRKYAVFQEVESKECPFRNFCFFSLFISVVDRTFNVWNEDISVKGKSFVKEYDIINQIIY